MAPSSSTDEPPVAVDDDYSMPQGGTLDIQTPGVLANDLPGPTQLNAVLVRESTESDKVDLRGDGSLRYTEEGAPLFEGRTCIEYKVVDAQGRDSNIGHVRVQVGGGGNGAPTAEPDLFGISQGAALDVSPPGVLWNDSDRECDGLQAILVASSMPATQLEFRTDGSFGYQPKPKFRGEAWIDYKARDVHGAESSIVRVNIIVGGRITRPCPDGPRCLEGGTDRRRGDIAATCGLARFDWYDNIEDKTFVETDDRACVILLSNPVAKELLNLAIRNGDTLSETFAGTFASSIFDDADRIILKRNLKKSGFELLAKVFPAVGKALTTMNFIVNLGKLTALHAIPLADLFILNQIENHGACIAFYSEVDDRTLQVDWQLTYNPSSLRYPRKDQELTIPRRWDREERFLRGDKFKQHRFNLECGSDGMAVLGRWRDTSRIYREPGSIVVR